MQAGKQVDLFFLRRKDLHVVSETFGQKCANARDTGCRSSGDTEHPRETVYRLYGLEIPVCTHSFHRTAASRSCNYAETRRRTRKGSDISDRLSIPHARLFFIHYRAVG